MDILQEREVGPAETGWLTLQSGQHRARAVSLVAAVIPVLMFATVVVLRGGFVTPVSALARIAGISLLVVNVAAFGSRERWLLSGPMLSVFVLLLVTALGLSPVGDRTVIGTCVALAGVAAWVWNMVAVVARAGVLCSCGLLLLGLFLGLYAQGVYWGVGSIHDVVYAESMIAGRVRPDVAEQAAVVNMIATYRLASTGLDGLLPLKYHNGSLWIAEGLRRICGFRAIDFLAYGYGVLLIPLYVASFFGCAELLFSFVRKWDVPTFAFWMATAIAFVGVFPLTDDPLHLNFNEAIIDSDSFLFAITLSLLFIGVGVWFYASLRERKFRWLAWERMAIAVVLPAALSLAGWVKISQIYLLLALMIWLGLRVKWMRAWPFQAGTLVSVVIFFAMYYGEIGANRSNFALFNFDRVAPEWVPYFFVAHFAWVWLLLVLWARFYGVRTLRDLAGAVRAGDSILVEMGFVAVVAGLIPYLLINFNSPAWKYFTNFQGVMGGVFAVVFLPAFGWTDIVRRAREGSLRLTQALLAGLAVAVCGHLFITTVAAEYRMLKRDCETRALLAGMAETAWRLEVRSIRERRFVVVEKWADRVRLASCLADIRDESIEQRRGLVLYIPKTNRGYWDMRQAGDGATPFIAPALASVPMVEGLPEFADIGWARVGWGYPQYKLLSAPEAPAENLGRALEKAREGGFRKLLVLRGVNAGGCVMQEIPLS